VISQVVGLSAVREGKRGSAQPQVREAQARQRAASSARSASAAARSLKRAKRKRGGAQPQAIDRRYSFRAVTVRGMP